MNYSLAMLMLLCVPILQTNKKNIVEEKKQQLSNVDKQKIGEFTKKTMNFYVKNLIDKIHKLIIKELKLM